MPQSHVYIGAVKTPGEAQSEAQEAQIRTLTLQQAVEQRRAQIEAQQRQQAQQQWLTGAATQFTHDDGSPDFDRIIAESYKQFPDLGQKLEEHVGKMRKQAVDARKVELDNEKAQHDADLQTLTQMTTPETWAAFRPKIRDKALAQALGDTFNPQVLEQLRQGGLSESERLNRLKANADLYAKDPHLAFLQEIAEAHDDDGIADAVAGARLMLPAEAVQSYAQRIGIGQPGAQERAKALLAQAVNQSASGGTSDYAHFLERYAKDKGKTAADLTQAEELDARKKFGQADDAARRPLAPIVIQTAQGPMVTTGPDRQAVAPVIGPDGKPLGMAPTSTQRDRMAGMQTASAIVDSIDELSAKINTGQGALAKITGAAEKAKAAANLNDDLSEYQAVVSGFTPLLARAVGHTGVLTEQDVQSVRAMLPQPGDSKSVRDRKMSRIRTIMGRMPGGGAVSTPSSSAPSTSLIATPPPDQSGNWKWNGTAWVKK